MALFGSKKKVEATIIPKKEKIVKAEQKAVKTEKAVVALPAQSTGQSAGSIIRPRVTEKSGLLSQGNVYTFEVSKNSNKNSISSAIKALYKVSPIRVAIINSPSKNVFVRGRKGVVPGVRKALVTLKKGDKIDFV